MGRNYHIPLQISGASDKIGFLLLSKTNRSRFVLMQGARKCECLQHLPARYLPSIPMFPENHVHGLCRALQKAVVSFPSFLCFLKWALPFLSSMAYEQGTWTQIVAFFIFFSLYRWIINKAVKSGACNFSWSLHQSCVSGGAGREIFIRLP